MIRYSITLIRMEQAQEIATLYKIENFEDDMIYIGTTFLKAHELIHYYRAQAVNGRSRLNKHMKYVGPDKFTIKVIKTMPGVPTHELQAITHAEMDRYHGQRLLNDERDFSDNIRLKIARKAEFFNKLRLQIKEAELIKKNKHLNKHAYEPDSDSD